MSEKAPATVTSRTSQIEEMIEKYSKGLEGTRKRSSRPLVSIKTVLLTGSSGNLGSHILALLLNDDRVNKVYAFNRPSATKQTILERHATRFEDRGLDVDLLTSEKITYLTGDAAQAHLGLDYNLYREVRFILWNRIVNIQLFFSCVILWTSSSIMPGSSTLIFHFLHMKITFALRETLLTWHSRDPRESRYVSYSRHQWHLRSHGLKTKALPLKQ